MAVEPAAAAGGGGQINEISDSESSVKASASSLIFCAFCTESAAVFHFMTLDRNDPLNNGVFARRRRLAAAERSERRVGGGAGRERPGLRGLLDSSRWRRAATVLG